MNRSSVLAFGLVLVMSGCGVTAPHHSPGYADLEGLHWWDVDATLNLSLGPGVLRFAAGMIEDDPGLQEFLRNVDGVLIHKYEVDGDPAEVAEDLDHMSAQLRLEGWEPVVLVRDEGEVAHVLIKIDQQSILGITVLTSDGLEVVLVNIMGELRPEMFNETRVVTDLPILLADG